MDTSSRESRPEGSHCAFAADTPPLCARFRRVGDVYGGTSRYMLRVAQELQGAETSFVDLSYNLSAERTIPEGESEEDKKAQDQADDAEIVERLEKAIRSDTKVRWLSGLPSGRARR